MKQPARLLTSLVALPFRTLVIAFLLSLGVNIIALLIQIRVKFPPAKHHSYHHHDHPRELDLGTLRTVNMDFHDDDERYPLNGTQGWAEWNSMVPPGKAAIYLGEEFWPYHTSMWHQYHCLNHIRSLIANGDDGSEHTQHCFHYIRKALLCAADLTLEEVETGERKDKRKMATVDHVAHTCRDWSQVYAYMVAEHEKWTPEMELRINLPAPPVD
ncbi:hypothetical protein BV25DRAFT_1918162 [Artomyces pyxidatus]|uniref:Uncharacterized protein n=1 Tax=Artomyces pyxidatus TaxID=48021 RepID=A0ACB8SU70_9AGAM|nr:hypothetical protein BV25DRAFT_1918162 [Artomyces pyxidatus]